MKSEIESFLRFLLFVSSPIKLCNNHWPSIVVIIHQPPIQCTSAASEGLKLSR